MVNGSKMIMPLDSRVVLHEVYGTLLAKRPSSFKTPPAGSEWILTSLLG